MRLLGHEHQHTPYRVRYHGRGRVRPARPAITASFQNRRGDIRVVRLCHTRAAQAQTRTTRPALKPALMGFEKPAAFDEGDKVSGTARDKVASLTYSNRPAGAVGSTEP